MILRKALPLALIVIGCWNSFLSFFITPYRSPEPLALFSPLARVFVQPGFFYQKFIELTGQDGEKLLIPYNAGDNPPNSRMLYMVSMFANTIPPQDLQKMVNFEFCQTKNKVSADFQVRKISLVWKRATHEKERRWEWLCP